MIPLTRIFSLFFQSSLLNANYVGILTWAILLGLALRTANDTTKKVLADIADGTSLVVS